MHRVDDVFFLQKINFKNSAAIRNVFHEIISHPRTKEAINTAPTNASTHFTIQYILSVVSQSKVLATCARFPVTCLLGGARGIYLLLVINIYT